MRASEARYRLIAENTGDVIWTYDLASRRITYVSPSVRRVRGYSPEEVLAQSLEDMLTPESYRYATHPACGADCGIGERRRVRPDCGRRAGQHVQGRLHRDDGDGGHAVDR